MNTKHLQQYDIEIPVIEALSPEMLNYLYTTPDIVELPRKCVVTKYH